MCIPHVRSGNVAPPRTPTAGSVPRRLPAQTAALPRPAAAPGTSPAARERRLSRPRGARPLPGPPAPRPAQRPPRGAARARRDRRFASRPPRPRPARRLRGAARRAQECALRLNSGGAGAAAAGGRRRLGAPGEPPWRGAAPGAAAPAAEAARRCCDSGWDWPSSSPAPERGPRAGVPGARRRRSERSRGGGSGGRGQPACHRLYDEIQAEPDADVRPGGLQEAGGVPVLPQRAGGRGEPAEHVGRGAPGRVGSGPVRPGPARPRFPSHRPRRRRIPLSGRGARAPPGRRPQRARSFRGSRHPERRQRRHGGAVRVVAGRGRWQAAPGPCRSERGRGRGGRASRPPSWGGGVRAHVRGAAFVRGPGSSRRGEESREGGGH